jgi:hypothetical protein
VSNHNNILLEVLVKKLIPILAIGVLLAAGCATKPPAPEPEPEPVPQPAPTPTVSQAEVDGLLAEAAALRKKAFDLKLFEVVADDYKAADAKYVEGKTAYDAKDNEKAAPVLKDAVAAFKEVLAKGAGILAAENRKRADEMKALAVEAGAPETAAERMAQGDAAYASGASLSEAKKDEEALVAFEKARQTYEAAYKKAKALGIRASIEEKDFAQYDAGNFKLADEKLAESDALFAADPDGALDALDEATLRYNLVVQKGWQTYAVERKTPADDAKRRSEEIKAQVAVKEKYAEALAVYNNASSLMAGGNYQEAGPEFDRSAELFEEAYAEAEVKRDAALAALAEAEARTQESESKARSGDEILGTAED